MSLAKSSKRILIIEDEVMLGEIMQDTIQQYYEHVTFINEADKVTEHLDANSYDLILSDINMPKLDGPSLIALVRSKGLLTPVIFITGNLTLEYTLKALRLGVSDVIAKPVSDEQLIDSIANVLELQKRKNLLYEQKKHLEKSTPESKMIGLFHTKIARKRAF